MSSIAKVSNMGIFVFKFTMDGKFVQMLNCPDMIMLTVFLHSNLKRSLFLFLSICVTTFGNFSCSVCKKKVMFFFFLPIIETHVHHLLLPWALYLLLYLIIIHDIV